VTSKTTGQNTRSCTRASRQTTANQNGMRKKGERFRQRVCSRSFIKIKKTKRQMSFFSKQVRHFDLSPRRRRANLAVCNKFGI